MAEGMMGFIGAGHMNGALSAGLLRKKFFSQKAMIVSDHKQENLDRFLKNQDSKLIKTTMDNLLLCRKAGTIVLGIKPQQAEEVLKGISKELSAEKTLISLCAGLQIKDIRSIVGNEVSVIRTMPNAATEVEEGFTALCKDDFTQEKAIIFAEKMFSSVGQTAQVEEKILDVVTALSGSGLAYFYKMFNEMMRFSAQKGVPEEIAKRMICQTAQGACAMTSASDLPLEERIEQVASPGGTTQAGLSILTQAGFGEMLQKCFDAAYRRSEVLSLGTSEK